MIRGTLVTLLLACCMSMHGQSAPVPMEKTSSVQDSAVVPALAISGYAEVYFAYDLSSPGNGERPSFLYNYRRTNEVNVNLTYLKATYAKDRVRANLALMAGTYSQYNLAAEPAQLRNLLEANIGVRLSAKRDLWLDAGVLPSHIGFESAIGADCWNLTRSLWAENTPYFEAGARLSYKPNDHLTLAALYLNGWQRIQRQAGNTAPAFGTQINATTTNGTQVNWSTFIGRETPDSVGLWRYYNNFYAVFDGDTTGLTLGFDVGVQELPNRKITGWFGPVMMVRQRFCKNWWGVGRVEFFNDEDRIVLPVERPMMSATLGADKWITDNVLWRAEVRWLGIEEKVFEDADQRAIGTNWAITTAMSAKF